MEKLNKMEMNRYLNIHGLEQSIALMYFLHKLIYEFNRILTKTSVRIFKEIDNLILKFTWKTNVENKVILEELYYLMLRIVIKLQEYEQEKDQCNR